MSINLKLPTVISPATARRLSPNIVLSTVSAGHIPSVSISNWIAPRMGFSVHASNINPVAVTIAVTIAVTASIATGMASAMTSAMAIRVASAFRISNFVFAILSLPQSF